MTIVYILIVLFFILYARKDFSKSLILFAAIHNLFNSGMAIRFQPPAITIDLLLNVFFVFMYYTKYKNIVKSSKEPFFKQSFVWMIISLMISTIVAVLGGNTSAITMGIRTILSQYVFIFIFWHVCNTEKQLLYFSKCIIVAFTIVLVYGLFEYITNSNPILNIIHANIPDAYADDKLYISDLEYTLRGGRARLQSLFYITILYGISSVLFVFYVITVFRKQKDFEINKQYMYFLVACGLFACYLSNSKTPIIAIPIIFLPYIFKRKYSIFILIILAYFIFNPNLFNSLLSNVVNINAFDVNNDDPNAGSTVAMRLIQLEISFNAFMQSPIWGNGLRYSGYLASTSAGAELLGAESCWFKLLIEQGVLGILAFVNIIYTFVKKGVEISKNDRCTLGFFGLGFYLIVSITDIGFELFYVLFIALYKIYGINKSKMEVSVQK